MKENKKMYIVLGVALVLVLGIILLVNKKGDSDKEIMNDFYELLNSRKYELLYIAKSDCSYCNMFDNNLNEITSVQDFKYLKIYIDKILASSANEIIERLEITELATPYIAIIKEGEVVDTFSYVEPNELLEKLKTYNFVDKDLKLDINYLTLEDYYNLVESGKKVVIGFSSTNNKNSETRLFKNALKEISKENGIEINYFELLFTADEEYKEFLKTFADIETENIPLLAVFENKKVVDYINVGTTKEGLQTFLKEQKMIK